MKCGFILGLGLLLSVTASANNYKCSFSAGKGSGNIFIPDTVLEITNGTSKPDANMATAIPHSQKSIMINLFSPGLNLEAVGVTFAEHDSVTGKVDPSKTYWASVLLAQKNLPSFFSIAGEWDAVSYYTLDCNQK